MAPKEEFDVELWSPKTLLGRKVKSKEVASMQQLVESGKTVVEPEITDALLPGLESDFIFIGQAKGKFGGGKRRAMRQTQKKTKEGGKLHFTAMAVVGNRDGFVGIGTGTAKETVLAREKALKKAKKNMLAVVRGCGSWECTCGEHHSLPFAAKGKSGSVELILLPAPKGTGLAVEKELRKILSLAGYKDLWSKVSGETMQKINMVNACMNALKNASYHKIREEDYIKITHGSKNK